MLRMVVKNAMNQIRTVSSTTHQMGSRLLSGNKSALRCTAYLRPASREFSRALPSVAVPFRMPAQEQRRAVTVSATAAAEETFTYEAEVDRLMDMIVNSLYSNREVFLRELVSNASDALDKIRIQALQNNDEYKTGDNLEIRIKADKENKTITIEDTGVGMTKEELLSSLGTIARSGTAKFAEAMKDSNDANLIGRFGVGFYSAYLVADRVVVQTKSNADSKQWAYESTAGAHSYKVREEPDGDIARGTRITLHLKTDAEELADENKLGALIKQYSEFISFPIKLWATKQVPVEVVDDEATKKAQEEADKKAKEEGKDAADPVKPVFKTDWQPATDWKVQNDNKPLWTRSPKEVAKDEYSSFFKSTFKEFIDPLAQSHFNVEGTIEFSALLFVPGMAPFDQQEMMQRSKNIRLYVKRVFISDEFDEDLMPRYLSFIKGIVDSSDLPLNVSREILQENRVVRLIRKQMVKRSLDMIADIADRENKEDYKTFWDAFGRNLKLGILEDAANKDTLAKLIRFPSSNGDEMTSLDEYVSRKKDGQKQIYYLAAESTAAAEASPYVEVLKSKGYEVLYLTEPIDEIALSNLEQYEGMALADVTREDLQLDESEEDKKKVEAAAEALKPVTDYMAKVLSDKVEKVVVSNRLADSPAIVVASKMGWSANMERIMKAQAMGDTRAAEMMRGRRIMEINADHPIVKNIKAKIELESREAKDMVTLLFETASLTGGFTIDSPKEYASRVYSMMAGTSASDNDVKQVDAEVV